MSAHINKSVHSGHFNSFNQFFGRNSSGLWSTSGIKNKSREAVTEYKVLSQNKEMAYVEIKPKTGRTHQIRVHLAHIGLPVVGDRQYGPPLKDIILRFHSTSKPIIDRLKTVNRQLLHAYRLQFNHPINSKELDLTTILPEDFQNILNILEKEMG